MIPSERLIELRRRQVDRLQRRVDALERENDNLRTVARHMLHFINRLGVLQSLNQTLLELRQNK